MSNTAGGQEPNNAGGVDGGKDTQQDNKVAYETYKKTVDQVHNQKRELDELRSKIAEFNARQESQEKEKLESQQKFEELYKSEQEKASKILEEKSLVEKQFQKHLKENALKSELGKIKKDEYLQFADIDSITLDESGTINIDSVKDVANKFRENYSDLLISETNLPPSDAPKGKSGKKLSYDDWLKLPAKDQKARLKDVI